METSAALDAPEQATRTPARDISLSGSFLIWEVELQAAACRHQVDQGLAAAGRERCGPCRPPAPQRDPGESQARTAHSARGQDGVGGRTARPGVPRRRGTGYGGPAA